MTELPDWINVGAKVAIRSGGWRDDYTIKTVERFTATQIVLDGDVRVRKDRATWDLLPLSDPTVVRLRTRRRVDRLRTDLDGLLRAFSDSAFRGDESDVFAVLDEAAAMVSRTRATVAALTEGRS